MLCVHAHVSVLADATVCVSTRLLPGPPVGKVKEDREADSKCNKDPFPVSGWEGPSITESFVLHLSVCDGKAQG